MLRPKDKVLNVGLGRGPVSHNRHVLEVDFDASADISSVLDTIYEALKTFEWFNWEGNIALIAPYRDLDGTYYISFNAVGTFGLLSSILNLRWVPVRVWAARSARLVTADTTGRHMLVGQRRWWCDAGTGTTVIISTEAYDQPRGFLNWLGFRLMGKKKQVDVWERYFKYIEAQLVANHGGRNPRLKPDLPTPKPRPDVSWLPRQPYPGKETL
jgi:hypothetical protein